MDTTIRNILNTIIIPNATLLDSICTDLWSVIIRYYNKPPSIYAVGDVDSTYPNYELIEADDHFLGIFWSVLHNNTIYSLCDTKGYEALFVGVSKIFVRDECIGWRIDSTKGGFVDFCGPFSDIAFSDIAFCNTRICNWICRKWCLFKFTG